jgi:hypothetical protein
MLLLLEILGVEGVQERIGYPVLGPDSLELLSRSTNVAVLEDGFQLSGRVGEFPGVDIQRAPAYRMCVAVCGYQVVALQ